MNKQLYELDRIEKIFENKSSREIKDLLTKIIAKFIDDEFCPEDGIYVPVGEKEDGSIDEPDFKGARKFKRGDAWPDDRSWIPVSYMAMYLL